MTKDTQGSLVKTFLLKANGHRFSLGLSVFAILLGLITFSSLSSFSPFEIDSNALLVVLVLDIVVLLILSILISKKLVEIWLKRRKGLMKTRLHVRLTVLFGVLAVTPAIIMTVFSVVFFHVGIQDWFSTRVKTALDESVQVAKSYLEEHKRLVGRDANLMAHDLRDNLERLSKDREEFNQYLTVMARLRSMSEALVFDHTHSVLGKSDLSFALEFEPVPSAAVKEAETGLPVVLTSRHHDRVRALVQVSGSPDRYLFVGRAVDPAVLNHLQKAESTVSKYKTLEGKRVGFEVIFILLFSLVALLLLLLAIWIGLVVSGQIISPIARLIDAVERIGEGDLTARVPEGKREDEITLLSRAFNRMTEQLQTNQSALLEANQQLEERRRFIESTLAGVSSGVMGLDREGRLNVSNEAFQKLLGKKPGEYHGQLSKEFFPEIEPILERARKSPGLLQEQEVRLTPKGMAPKTFLVHVVAYQKNRSLQGYVVTLDDITAILAVQKQVAWSDVARRIAHEIKNPLTPIQLSAERLRQKYLKEVKDGESFGQYIEMISKQVRHIQDMIGEFVAFARMPSPVMKKHDLRAILKDAILFHKNHHPGVTLKDTLPQKSLYQYCDEGQIMQCLTNLLKNAVEAMEESGVKKPELTLILKREKRETHIEIMDNGPGFSFDQDQNLMDPYVTTRKEGTGLGLSIVKKIMDDHNGRLEIDNISGGGGRARLVFG